MRVMNIAAAMVLLGSLAACGDGSSSADGGAVTLRMTTWSANEAHVKLFTDIAAAYHGAHPNVTVTFDALPVENYTTAVTTQIAGGNTPDLAWILESAAPDFVSSGALVPLDDAVENPSEIAPTTTALWKQDGKLLAYPFSTSPFGVFVNTDLVPDLPTGDDWTWDAAIGAAKKAAVSSGKQGLVPRDFDYKDWTNLAPIFDAWGAQAWSADGKTCGFDKQPMVDAMTFIHQAIFDDKAIPGPGVAADFFAGDAAMTITQISRASLLEDAPFDWTLVRLPSGPRGTYAVFGQAGIGVLKKGEHVDEAKDFLRFFTNDANSAKLAAYFPPPRTPQLTPETLAESNPLLKPENLKDVVIDGISSGVVKPSHRNSAEIVQAVRSALDPMWKPGADVPAVLTGVCTAIQPLLTK
ncbi:ABC transporter substrate-binding protein [Mangrovihabitans endophyticus]|uniref:Sugar ABC transporter substrate-binding protein n=1 Tax=Mangrovihabitans endophyticus TaxID=1751298 RepID=A0A8J3FN56_9ACTN|nr:extracellular solute-binding protein [Mangrovihabitans endophyticus]GGK81315.1 sugar ABC transporter substrate-binding protein [Mangrovihabitans endophyticus]